MPRRMAELRLEGSASDANGHSSLRFFPFGASSFAAREARVLCRQARPLDDPCVAPSDESRPGSAPTTVVLPLWYRLLRPTRPDRPQPGTMGTRGTLTDASTHEAGRLGAERSLVQIQSPRLSRSPLPKRAFGMLGGPLNRPQRSSWHQPWYQTGTQVRVRLSTCAPAGAGLLVIPEQRHPSFRDATSATCLKCCSRPPRPARCSDCARNRRLARAQWMVPAAAPDARASRCRAPVRRHDAETAAHAPAGARAARS
jgi:hypothetical protein